MGPNVYEEQKLKVSVNRAKNLRSSGMYTRSPEPWDGKTIQEAEKALEELGYGSVIKGLDKRLEEELL